MLYKPEERQTDGVREEEQRARINGASDENERE